MFVTIGLALDVCPANTTCQGPLATKFSASMNNESFVLPTKLSMLQAFFSNVGGVYTTDFPANPPVQFDYTNASINNNLPLLFAHKGTKVTKLKFNTTVELVFQNTAIIGIENHPMHLHGYNFHVLAQGVWIMHCHLDVHLPWGLATVFVVENGPTPTTTLPPPPADLPQC
ncbi:Cupredoxin [Corchorus olitorius]|uniref:Cupredoxin n=1 Tax=Corchorus olitorius TaxID=93759 RepID=A0A1R3L4R8_9ROSI|nr:Cupredoxin [Corchorus olitorius]